MSEEPKQEPAVPDTSVTSATISTNKVESKPIWTYVGWAAILAGAITLGVLTSPKKKVVEPPKQEVVATPAQVDAAIKKDAIEEERGIPRERIIEAIEMALATAYKNIRNQAITVS